MHKKKKTYICLGWLPGRYLLRRHNTFSHLPQCTRLPNRMFRNSCILTRKGQVSNNIVWCIRRCFHRNQNFHYGIHHSTMSSCTYYRNFRFSASHQNRRSFRYQLRKSKVKTCLDLITKCLLEK